MRILHMYDPQLFTNGMLLIEFPRDPLDRLRLLAHLEYKFPRMHTLTGEKPSSMMSYGISHIMISQNGLDVYGHHRGNNEANDWYTGLVLSYQDVKRVLVSYNNC